MNSKILILVIAALASLTANAPKVKVLSGSQIKKLIPGKKIVSGPTNDSIELFYPDGRYHHFFSNLQASGTYTIIGNEICAQSLKKLCSRIAKDRNGNYYLISSDDRFKRPYRVTISALTQEN